MVTAIGVDIVDVARIRRLIDRHGERFLVRVLGEQELALVRGRGDTAQFVAGRFAAKEAVVKALGKYLVERPAWSRIEILPDSSGQPVVRYPQSVMKRLASVRTLVSISHEKMYAVATAILSEDS
jgi:holo-[acyl-carrier protein] synthase